MRESSTTNVSDTARAASVKRGLFRYEVAGHGKSVVDVFGALLHHPRFEPIASSPGRILHGGRLTLDRSEGYGGWEFYLIHHDAFLVTNELVFDTQRVETVPGEGLVAFHLRMSGRLEMEIPGLRSDLTVEGPRLLMWYQSPGANVTERVRKGTRECTITLYCSISYMRDLIERNGIANSRLLEEIERGAERGVWYREFDMTAGLAQVGSQLLRNSYVGGLRYLHAELKALELFCAILQIHCGETGTEQAFGNSACSRLDKARQLLQLQLNGAVRIADVARSIGMSETLLKRGFKERFGVSVFDFRLDCRMRHALELLHFNRLSVGQVAYAVGYQHLSSFSAAFSTFYGYHPLLARLQSKSIIQTNRPDPSNRLREPAA